jgi:preprotein translocase subunit SecE
MADNETKTKEKDEEEAAEQLGMSESAPLVKSEEAAPEHAEGEEGVAAAQLGEKRFVYAAYMGGAIGVAFLMTKVLHGLWLKLALWKPAVGEPRDDVLMVMSGVVGVVVALYYWRRTRARQLAEEVAQELSKVTWPSKQEVTSSTTVVIVTTAVATVFFALMDRFWGFVTNFVYGI